MQDGDVVGAGRDDGQRIVHAAQVELAHGAGVPLLDEEAAAAFVQRGDDFEFGFGEFEAVDVVFAIGVGVGQKHHGGGLLDQCGRDVAAQGIFGRLGGKYAQAVLLTDGFLLVFGKFFQGAAAVEDFPEFVHDINERASVDELFQTVDEVLDDGVAHFGVVDDVGVVKTDDVGARKIDGVARVVKYPAQRAGLRPFAQARKDAVFTHIGQRLLQVGHGAQRHGCVQNGAHGTQNVVFFARCV